MFIEPQFSDLYRKSPLILVDVGASGGVQKHWKQARPYLKVVGFEPDKREYSNLSKQNNAETMFLNTALHNEKSQVTFHLTKKQQTSSMFEPNTHFLTAFPEADRFDIASKVTVEADTLDRQFEQHNVDDADFIKIDTQGSELHILEGAQSTLSRQMFGVEVEVEFSELYKGQPLFTDVDVFLRSQGFQLFDLQGCYWKREKGKRFGRGRGQMVYGNALYLRHMDTLNTWLSSRTDEEKKSKILRALAVCALYGYLDYAYEVFDASRLCFRLDERDVIDQWFNKQIKMEHRIPEFKGKRWLANTVQSFWNTIRPSENGWGTVDRDLGNR